MNLEGSEDKGNSESDGFSRLDLVKHSVRTCIEVLEPDDSVCLITFSDNAKVVFETSKMTPSGKQNAIDCLQKIEADAMTNIWDGLRVALLNVQKITDPNINVSVVLLTDGSLSLLFYFFFVN
jgi:Mg-chelatase subunit ChlD